jgi:hypothetical protein
VSFEDPDDTTEAHERRIVRCRSCNAKIIWLLTKNLKPMPVDADTVEPGDTELNLQTKSNPEGTHISHFSTCPNANQHRKPR